MCHFRVGINLIGFRLERRSIESLRTPRSHLHWWKGEKRASLKAFTSSDMELHFCCLQWYYDSAWFLMKFTQTFFNSLPPANVVCEGYVFTPVCDSVNGGACVVAPGGGRAWLLQGGLGGMRGCSQGGMCGCSRGGAWLLWGGGGACVVAPGGHAWLLRGACVVALGGHACLLGGGMCGIQ